MSVKNSLYRALPSMNAILEAFTDPKRGLAQTLPDLLVPRPLLRDCIDDFLGMCREDIAEGRISNTDELALDTLLPRMKQYVKTHSRPHFRRVLNATGVVIHTNLGRSLLADEAVDAVAQAARCYSNLEFNLSTGARGSRYEHVEDLVCRLTGAEAALVVNNNAAAVLLTLDTLCKGREVVTSRGELVEIGGSFRIPEVMEKSGCTLREVGATNRTHLKDYAAAINDNTAALLKVHASNFRIIGFTAEVSREDMAGLAHKHDLPCIEDLGSGTLFDFAGAGLAHLATDPTPAKVLAAGVDVVTFSGDKVLGGPQAGIIAGKAGYIESIKKNPMNRALRIDKMTLAALEASLRLYLDPQLAKTRIPTLRMICMEPAELKKRATRLAGQIRRHVPENLAEVTIRQGASRTGGGAFPEHDLPTWLVCLALRSASPDAVRQALLQLDTPLVVRVENDAVVLDPRTLRDDELPLAASSLGEALA